MPAIDHTHAVRIAPRIYWVGDYLPGDPFQCHPYLIENGDESILIDPGSMLEFEAVATKVEEVVPLSDIKYIVLHHQDPDLAAAVPAFEECIERDDLTIVTHSRMTVLIKHYKIHSPYYEIDNNELQLTTKNGLRLQFLTTPYCHSPGAFVSYEPESGVLFSGDIFGGVEESWHFYADENYFNAIKGFHSSYIPSRDILNYALRKIEQLDMHLIAPQHGSIIRRPLIRPLIEKMKKLECGLYIDQKYNEELIDTIEKLRQREQELKEYKDRLEERVREKTFHLEEANQKLETEQKRLIQFNRYLEELNAVDVSVLAESAVRHVLDIANAQLSVFYAQKNGQLELIAKRSVDEALLGNPLFHPSSGGIVEKAFETNQWITVDNIAEEVAPEVDLGAFRAKLQTVRAIPLSFQEKQFGFITTWHVNGIDGQVGSVFDHEINQNFDRNQHVTLFKFMG